MSLDVGDRRIGVALSDPTGLLASPLTVVERQSVAVDLRKILELAAAYGAEEIVVGLPRSLDGGLYHQAQKVLDFGQRLAQETEILITFWDEQFTTVAAQRLRAEQKAPKGQSRRHLDALAAAFILQGYLDHRRGRTDPQRDTVS